MLTILYIIASAIAQSTNQNQTWPPNTSATGSTEHSARGSRDYKSSNAIDNKEDTFWNDDTEGGYPDTLTITSPVAVTLDGIILLSYDDGVPVDFTVDTNNGSGWTQGAGITGNSKVLQFVKFPRSLLCLQLRVNVMLAQKVPFGEFTRISELSPVYADLSSSVPAITVTALAEASTSLSPAPTTTTPSTSSTQNENAAVIAAGVLGTIAGVLILALIAAVLIERRRRNNKGESTPPIDQYHHHPGRPSLIGGANTLIPPSSSYAPDLTTASGVPIMPPTSSSSPSYPGAILGITIDNRRPTELYGTGLFVELPEERAREGH